MSEQDSSPTADPHLPASEQGSGIISGDEAGAGDTSLPASESDMLADEHASGEPQSWPGSSFGSIPPPG